MNSEIEGIIHYSLWMEMIVFSKTAGVASSDDERIPVT